RTRQDCAEPHHGGLGQEAARARAGDQAGALSRALAVPYQVSSSGPSLALAPPRARSQGPDWFAFEPGAGARNLRWACVGVPARGDGSGMAAGLMIGIGTGLASALLFYSAGHGTPLLSTLLLLLTPLPSLLAGLGWGWLAASAGALAGALAMAFVGTATFAAG